MSAVGFFDNIAKSFRSAVGGTDDELLATGVLGRADLLGIDVSGMTIQMNNSLVERKCTFQLQVYLDGQQPFPAIVEQRVQEVYLPQLVPGQTVLAVRVDPADHTRVAIDWASEVPTVTLPAGEGKDSAAWILANGAEAKVVLIANQPIGAKSPIGDDVHALTLTIDRGTESYQIQVGNGVPANALPLLYPGSKLWARVGEGPNDVVVDWARGERVG